MKFRTEIELHRTKLPHLELADPMATIGSCFSDAIGGRLEESGFNVAVNPFGVLFNPLSIAAMVQRVREDRPFCEEDFTQHSDGMWHLLALESRCQGTALPELVALCNRKFAQAAKYLQESKFLFVTFGTAWSFHYKPENRLVGNCHKLPANLFERRLASAKEIVEVWKPLIRNDCNYVFTVSPVRHLNDGLHGNTLSKCVLHLAVDELCKLANVEYFPAYEMLMDDLRDYRFYADDLKHPSAMAEEYIFGKFAKTYLSSETQLRAETIRKENKRKQHIPILRND